jgi:hypothetical protein
VKLIEAKAAEIEAANAAGAALAAPAGQPVVQAAE